MANDDKKDLPKTNAYEAIEAARIAESNAKFLANISFISDIKRKITSDDLCFNCSNCFRFSATLHYCTKDWPVTADQETAITECDKFQIMY